jgi:hypothetical protein
MKRSKVNFKTNVSSQFPTNGTGLIGANRVRAHIGEDVPDSFVNNVDDLQLFTEASGTNTYALVGDIISYTSGFMTVVKFPNGSTGASTLNVNGIGAKKIMKTPTTQVGSGDIPDNQIFILVYDSALDAAAGGFLIMKGPDGTTPDSLSRVEFDTTVASPTMDMGGYSDRIHVGSDPIAANKELLFSNDSAMIRATAFLEISGTRDITIPAITLVDISKWVWTKPATKFIWTADPGVYRLQWHHDGTNLHLDIYGLYTSTL